MAFKKFKPNSPQQAQFIKDVLDPNNVIVTLLSGRQLGKSWAGAAALAELIYNTSRMKRGVSWCVAFDYGQSKAAQDAFQMVLGWKSEGGLIINHLVSQNAYELYMGCFDNCSGCRGGPKHHHKPYYRVEFKSAENPDSLRGRAVDALWFDEAALLSEYAYMTTLPVVLATGGPIFCTTTPKGKNWFYDKIFMESLRSPNYKFIRGTTDDNPDLPQKVKDFIKNQYSGILYAQEIMGEFKTMAGLVYNFDEDKHCFGPEDELPSGEIVAGIDFGWKDPFVYIWALKTGDGRYFILDEIYKSGVTLDKMAIMIRQNPLERRVVRRYADPSRPEIRDMLEREGIMTWIAKNDREAGLNLVAKHFEDGALLINREKCLNGVRELSNYQWKKNGKEPQSTDDHFCDALRYVIASEEWMSPGEQLEQAYAQDDGSVVVLAPDGQKSRAFSQIFPTEDIEQQHEYACPECGWVVKLGEPCQQRHGSSFDPSPNDSWQ